MLEYIIQGSTFAAASAALGLEIVAKSPQWAQLFSIANLAVIMCITLIFLLTGLIVDFKNPELLQCADYFLCILTIGSTVLSAPSLKTDFPLACALIIFKSVISLVLLIGGILSTVKLTSGLRGKGFKKGAWLKPIVISTKASTAAFCVFLIVCSQFHEANSPMCRAICWAIAIFETILGSLLLYFCKGYKVSILIDVGGIINACFLLACAIACLLLGSSLLLVIMSFLGCLSAIACAVLTHSFYVLKWRQRLASKSIKNAYLKEENLKGEGDSTSGVDTSDHLAVKLLPKSAGIAVRIGTVFMATSALTIEAFCKSEGQPDNRLRMLIIGILAFCIVCSFGCMCASQAVPQYAGTIVCADIFDAVVLACASALCVSSCLTVSAPSVIFIWLSFASVSAVVFVEIYNYYKC